MKGSQQVLVGFIGVSAAQNVTDLSSKNWKLSSQAHGIDILAKVRGQAHLDLWREGIIPDPYVGLGDVELQWVGETNWTYSAVVDSL